MLIVVSITGEQAEARPWSSDVEGVSKLSGFLLYADAKRSFQPITNRLSNKVVLKITDNELKYAYFYLFDLQLWLRLCLLQYGFHLRGVHNIALDL